jgi:hypothetical protein
MATVIGASYGATLTADEHANSGKGFSLGDTSTDSAGNVWLYVQAAGDPFANRVVVVSAANTVVPALASNALRGLRVGVARTAIANGSYGWVQIYGTADVQVLASAAANVRLNTTATTGHLDDDGTVGAKEILGIALTTARPASNGTAPAVLNFPSVGATL